MSEDSPKPGFTCEVPVDGGMLFVGKYLSLRFAVTQEKARKALSDDENQGVVFVVPRTQLQALNVAQALILAVTARRDFEGIADPERFEQELQRVSQLLMSCQNQLSPAPSGALN